MDRYQARGLLLGEPIEVRRVGTSNSIILSSVFSAPSSSAQLSVTSLIDSGCTMSAFCRREWARKCGLQMIPLPRPRPLFLADGRSSELVTHRIDGFLTTGSHTERISCLVANLGADNDIILGFPWLQQHNPRIEWPTGAVEFCSAFCRDHCFPKKLADSMANITPVNLPPARPGKDLNCGIATSVNPALMEMPRSILKTSHCYQPPSVTDFNDEDNDHAAATSLHPGNPSRLMEPIDTPGNKSSDSDDELFNPSRFRPVPARKIQGRRVRFRLPSSKPSQDPRGIQEVQNFPDLDDADIETLAAPNFFALTRQKGVSVMRINYHDLVDTRDIDARVLPDLSDQDYQDVLHGRGNINQWKQVFAEGFHAFLDACFDPDSGSIRKVDEKDIQKFFDKAERPAPTEQQIKSKMPPEYHDLWSVALAQNATDLPPHRSYDHKIELIPGHKLPNARARACSPMELAVIKRWLDDHLSKGWIRPSTSPVASPLLLAKKPGGGVRICHDFRAVNNIALKNRYPLPLIKETLDLVGKAKIFTKVDVISAFNRIRIAQGHEWLTAFITRFGLYEQLVTPFGLSGAPATFQRYINDILYDLLDQCATAYLDDVLIFSQNKADHIGHVREVLQRLQSAGLQIDIDKSEFHTVKTKYLGLIITPGGIEMDPAKVQAIVEWEPPTSKRQLQRFLGFANFYRRFISNFSSVARPLHEMTKKDIAWNWTPECDIAFRRLKEIFKSAPTLAIFDWSKQTVVEVDASNWATGGTLSQWRDDQLRPVAYFSAKHSVQECNYDIYDKELLAIVKALEEWRPELEGVETPFEIYTDHKNLKTFTETKELNQRQMRWAGFLSRFNFRLIYRPGSVNIRPDALSRRPQDAPQGADDDRLRARRIPIIPADKVMLRTLGTGTMEIYALDTSRAIDDLITESYNGSTMMSIILANLRDPEARNWIPGLRQELRISFAECRVVANRAYFRNRLILPPDDQEIQLQVLHRTHNSAPAGHPGRVRTIDLLNRTYWWPNMTLAARNFCKGCLMCEKTKTPRVAPPGFLKPLPLPLSPWRDVSIDYITPLPPSCFLNGKFRHIAVVVDRLTKMRHYIATESLGAEELADRFFERVYSLHGAPSTMVSDRGSQFVSTFWRALSQRLGIELRPSSAFHPQTNGQTERINQEVETFLRLFVNWAQDDWARWLPVAEFAGNNAISSTTGVSPFFANYGFHPRLGVEPQTPVPPDLSDAQRIEFFKAHDIANRFEAIHTQVRALAKQAQDRYEVNANRRRSDTPLYKIGDMVMVNTQNMDLGRPVQKLSPKWEGPFKVIKTSSHTVTLDLPANFRIFPTFHVSLIKRRSLEKAPGQQDEDLEVNDGRVIVRTDGHKDTIEWKFKSILDYEQNTETGRWWYLVEWDNSGPPTWQPVSDLKGCDDQIWAYHDAHPEKPGPPAWVSRRARKQRLFELNREG